MNLFQIFSMLTFAVYVAVFAFIIWLVIWIIQSQKERNVLLKEISNKLDVLVNIKKEE